MADTDRARWDARWAQRENAVVGEPDPFVVRALEHVQTTLSGARAVDLASGLGRHAFELARRGFDAAAWDISSVGLAKLAELATAAGLTIETRCVDLEGGRALPTDEAFDLAVCVNYLDRGLLAAGPRLLRPGGYLCFVTYTADWPGEHPSRPALRLAAGELARGLGGLDTVYEREEGGRAGILAQRAVQR